MSIPRREARESIRFQLAVTRSLLVLMLCLHAGKGAAQSYGAPTGAHSEDKSAVEVAPRPEGSWRFIVSRDSPNSRDGIIPATAPPSTPAPPRFSSPPRDLRASF